MGGLEADIWVSKISGSAAMDQMKRHVDACKKHKNAANVRAT